MGWVYFVVVLAAASAGVFGVWSYKDAITRAKDAEEAAEYWKKEFGVETEVRKQREREYDDAQRAASISKKVAKELDSDRKSLEAALRAAMADKDNPSSVLATPLPDSIRRLRREHASCDTDFSVPCTGQPTGTHLSAPDERRNSVPGSYGSDGTQKRTASRQP